MSEIATRSREANREILDVLPVVPGFTTGALVPQNMGQALEMAKLMAAGKVGIPKHLRDEPAVCLRIIADAMQFGLNPFHLASDSYVVSDNLGYGAKSIHAMLIRSGLLVGRLDIDYAGENTSLTCSVAGVLRGAAMPKTKTVRLADIKVMNSPLWKSDTRQQLGYYTIRAWCRLHAPDAIMSLVSNTDPMIDVTPMPTAPAPATAMEAVTAQLSADADGVIQEVPEPDPEAPAASYGGPQPEAPAAAEPEPAAADEQMRPFTDPDYEQPSQKWLAQAVIEVSAMRTVELLTAWQGENAGHIQALSLRQAQSLNVATVKRQQQLKGRHK